MCDAEFPLELCTSFLFWCPGSRDSFKVGSAYTGTTLSAITQAQANGNGLDLRAQGF